MRTLGTSIVLFTAFAMAFSFGCGKKGEPSDESEAKPTVEVQLADVTVRPIRELISLNGSFAAGQGASAKLTPAVAGRISKVLVKEGDLVKQGRLLATLDTGVQASQEASAKAAVVAAMDQATQSKLSYEAAEADEKASVRSAEISLEQARLQRDSDVTQARLAYQAAREDLAKTRAGARPQELAQAHEATQQAQVARNRAQSEYKRDEQLWPEGYISRRQLEDAQASLATAESALASAQASESLVRAGARPEDLRGAEDRAAAARNAVGSAISLGSRRVQSAQAGLNQAEAAELGVQAKLKDVQTSEAFAKQKEADAAAASATTQLGEIRAPFDGQIARRLLNPGDPADTTTPVLEINRTKGSSVDFVAGALPAQASQIRSGMSAEISYGPSTAPGRVLAVSTADPTTGLSAIRIACASSPAIGTYGVVAIAVAESNHAIAVPDAAVLSRDGKDEVFRDVDGSATATEVKTGPSDAGYTQILSGLKPGQKVVLLGGYELDDGTKIKPAKGGKS